MPIYKGNTKVKSLYKGSTKIIKRYKGTDVIYRGLPSAYQEVEYIESTGTQYIDSGYVPNANTKIIFDCSFVSTPSAGSRQGRHGDGERLSIAYFSNNNTTELAIGGFQQISLSLLNVRHLFELDIPNAQAKIDGEVKATFTPITWTNQQTLYFFGRNTANGVDGLGQIRNYNIKIFESETIIRNFIPCYRKSDSVIGLYDLVNGVFYTNAGTGTFTKGGNV